MRKAVYWYKKSADQGNPISQYQLAVIYENGDGVPKNLEKSRYYYEQASKSKYDLTKNSLLEFELRNKSLQ